MKQNTLSLFLALIILVSSCSPGADSAISEVLDEGGSTSELAEEGESIFGTGEEFPWPDDLPRPLEPNPINLTISTEEEHTASVLFMPDEGGSVSVTDQNGVTFTLSIPANSLLGPEEISLTPLASLEGMPYGDGTAVGVMFGPEGLVLAKAGELKIEMPEGSDLSDAFAFATFAGGEDFHLTPWDIEGNTLRTGINHFSVTALQEVGYSQIEASEARYSPSSGQAVFEDAWARVTNQFPEGGDIVADAAELGLKTWFYSTVMPRLAAAAVDSDQIDRAVEEVLSWTDWIRGDDRFEREVELSWQGMGVAFANAFVKANYTCFAARAPEQALRMIRWLGIMDALQPKNADGSFRPGYLHGIAGRDTAILFIESCFKFSLEFRSRIELGDSQGRFTMQTALLQPLKIRFDAERLKIEETDVDLPYERFALEPLPSVCSLSTKQGNVTMKLLATANVNYRQTAIEEVWLEFIFNKKPQESMNCGPLLEFTHWHSNFAEAHTIVGRQQRIMVKLVIVRRLDSFAIYEFDGQSTAHATESTDIKLIHTPGNN